MINTVLLCGVSKVSGLKRKATARIVSEQIEAKNNDAPINAAIIYCLADTYRWYSGHADQRELFGSVFALAPLFACLDTSHAWATSIKESPVSGTAICQRQQCRIAT